MHYIEIGQDIIDAIKGGADWNGKSDSEEITGYITDFGGFVNMIAQYVMEIFNALKKYFNK